MMQAAIFAVAGVLCMAGAISIADAHPQIAIWGGFAAGADLVFALVDARDELLRRLT